MSDAAPATPRLEHVVRQVRAHTPRLAERDPPYFEAAVTLILRASRDGVVEVLFITRAVRDDDPWSGQVALPGGRHDADDASLEATAMRETLEEVDLDLRRDGSIVGALDELRPRTPVLPPVIVRPFVATISGGAEPRAQDEVAGLFWAPLEEILDPGASRDTEIRVRGVPARRPAIHHRGHVIWGMTERIVRNLGELL